MSKICTFCGALNSDSETVCVRCNKILTVSQKKVSNHKTFHLTIIIAWCIKIELLLGYHQELIKHQIFLRIKRIGFWVLWELVC